MQMNPSKRGPKWRPPCNCKRVLNEVLKLQYLLEYGQEPRQASAGAAPFTFMVFSEEMLWLLPACKLSQIRRSSHGWPPLFDKERLLAQISADYASMQSEHVQMRSRAATTSTCAVCGNMSSGCTLRRRYAAALLPLRPHSCPRSRACRMQGRHASTPSAQTQGVSACTCLRVLGTM